MRNINLDANINTNLIKKLSPTREVLINIKMALKAKDIEPFNNIIGKSVQNQFETWLNTEFPSLLTEKEDLQTAILRRLKNEILRSDVEGKEIDFNQKFLEISRLECQSNLPNDANKKRNFGLTKREFVAMVEKLQTGNEEIIEKIFLSEFQKCNSILISQTGSTKQEAYDYTMDALVEIRKEMISGKLLYGNLGSYFITKSINQFFRKNRKKRIEMTELSKEHDFIDDTALEDEGFNFELKEIVSQSIQKLGEECQSILKLYYYQEWSFQDIADDLGKSYAAIRKQATRCRDRFKSNLKAKSFIKFKSA